MEPVEGGIGSLLEDMEWVLSHGKGGDRTPGRKSCRSWMERHPGAFRERMEELKRERDEKGGGGGLLGGCGGLDEACPHCGMKRSEAVKGNEDLLELTRELLRKDGGE